MLVEKIKATMTLFLRSIVSDDLQSFKTPIIGANV